MNATNQEESAGPRNTITISAPPVDRLKFWTDTCREITQMQTGSGEAIDLYRKFGCRFWAPSELHVEHVMAALDGAMPGWEKEHPELFFQTLELNFPELLKRPNLGSAAA